ncbi:hypothetical protein C7H19_00750 [Aphanothece hegewaldii CCALA 016]|uniref:Uncharacterized protein n=1 Tax=Aphanothece hegewaldii CCALA 016 TaxID=2107694 RepID=A0A2T1M3L6_9CHRO|nr:hypothetical protein [Aphanothece hegewaldii]PSF39350.1 hypothetical protein C7H19_00750 [Aphanothece hegewaldii CCALA 016]
MKETLIKWLDRILIFNVFLVIIGFLWLMIAVLGQALGIPLGWELWYKLWLPLFNPAISILVLGAILSWVIKKINQKFVSN